MKTRPLTADQRQNLHNYMLTKYGAQAQDQTNALANIIEYGHTALCPNCGGTGNQLLSMYQECTDCLGTGIVKYGGTVS